MHATFVMAMFGWGVGFYGPPVFLHAVIQRTGWPLALVSAALTLHHLFGALVVTRLPRWHRRFGVGPTAVAGATCTALGTLGWALAEAPWQLLASALASGAGWVTMGAVAVNAAIAPWHAQTRPVALAKAYNGASIGGVVFSPLWVLLIGRWGFTTAAGVVGLAMVALLALLSATVFNKTPQQLGQQPDGDATDAAPAAAVVAPAPALPECARWRDRRLLTLALAMAAGLFAQIGLLAHLFSLLATSLGAPAAGLAMGFATACAMAGRLLVARCLPAGADRRVAAAAAYVAQLAGTVVLLLADGRPTAWILLGVALFGSGIGNATSLPPLIAQAEFAADDVPRVVATIVAAAQATYAFAPAAFGLALGAAAVGAPRIGSGTTVFFVAAALAQSLAIGCLLAGRRRR